MLKSAYSGDPVVGKFVAWLSTNLDNNTFKHRYTNRNTGKPWSCNSLFDAFTNYRWPHPAIPRLNAPAGATFATNAAALNALRADLLAALQLALADAAACQAAIDVMGWGGVRNGNVSWLLANQKGLAQLLIDTRNALNAGNSRHPVLTAKTLRFNAGMTKVYSLICDNFVIYDSRVAAALGWAVVKFCSTTSLTAVPDELCFPWAPAKEGKKQLAPKRRDPSEWPLKFSGLRSGPPHAEWNLKASWLLQATLNHANAAGSQFNGVGGPGGPLRALEAALFMIGYDLPPLSLGGAAGAQIVPAAAAPKRPSPAQTASRQPSGDDKAEWTPCYTLKHRKDFHYRITDRGIEVKSDKGVRTFPDADIDATLDRLSSHFAQNRFPLVLAPTEN